MSVDVTGALADSRAGEAVPYFWPLVALIVAYGCGLAFAARAFRWRRPSKESGWYVGRFIGIAILASCWLTVLPRTRFVGLLAMTVTTFVLWYAFGRSAPEVPSGHDAGRREAAKRSMGERRRNRDRRNRR